jgi:hypothetical protein
MTENLPVKQKILNDLNKSENKQNSDNVIALMAKRYDVSKNMVQKIIAEWSAGKNIGNEKEKLS